MQIIGRVAAAVASALVALVFVGSGTAGTDVTCGQEIMSPGVYTLGSDLSCAEAIRIGAPGVTVDLQGHTLSGSGDDSGFSVFTGPGPWPSPVMITNGTIRGFSSQFGAAIVVASSSVTLRHLTITQNRTGVLLYSAATARIEGNVISENESGVLATPGSAPEVESNWIVRNGSGIFASQTRGGYFRNNVVARNRYGISVNDGAPVTDNLVIHNLVNGITVTGPQSQSPYWVVTGNVAGGNGGYGIWAEFPPGHNGGNRASGNGSTPQC